MKFRDTGSNEPAAKAQRRSHPDGALRLAGNRCDRRLGIFHGLDDAPGANIENLALFRRCQLACRAVEQAHTKVFFQFLHPIAGDCRRQPHIAPGGRKIAQFDHPKEDLYIFKI